MSAYTIVMPGCNPKNPLNGSQGVSAAGNRWRAMARKRLRTDAAMHTLAEVPQVWCSGKFGAATVLIQRISPRPYDSDGWAAAAKPIRDGIADALRVKDNDPRVTWCYDQTRGDTKEYAVRVELAFMRDR